MASTLCLLLSFLSLFSLVSISESRVPSGAPFKPNAFFLSVRKDNATSLHVVNIHKRSPRRSIPFLVDLNGKYLWVNCDQNYSSSAYRAPLCHSTQCSLAGFHFCRKCPSTPARPGCHNNSCAIIATNPLTHQSSISELGLDVLSIQSIQAGSKPGPLAVVPQFLFACAPSTLLQGPFPRNVQGVAGLGHTQVALPLQLSSHFGFPPTFALCLPSSAKNNGVIFFGNAPFTTRSRIDLSKTLEYTPMAIGSQGEYYIFVRSIRINNIPLQLNTSLFSSTRGFKGTMISTTTPYTVLQRSIFTNFTQFFAKQLSYVPQVDAVSPFGVCFNSSHLTSTRVGPGVPNIDLVMQNKNVTWTIFGANSMVEARPGVSCLAFVDGGVNTRAPIVIGAYQLEDNFLHFDLVMSVLGFSSSLLFQRTNCGSFNLNSTTFKSEILY